MLVVVVACWLLLLGSWFLVLGCWLLAVGCLLLVVGCCLLILLVVFFVFCCGLLFVAGCCCCCCGGGDCVCGRRRRRRRRGRHHRRSLIFSYSYPSCCCCCCQRRTNSVSEKPGSIRQWWRYSECLSFLQAEALWPSAAPSPMRLVHPVKHLVMPKVFQSSLEVLRIRALDMNVNESQVVHSWDFLISPLKEVLSVCQEWL